VIPQLFLPRAACFLRGLERDDRELIIQIGLQLVVSRDGEVALGLDDEEARRHTHLEPLLFGIEPLFGEVATELRGLDALTILLEPKRRVPHFAHRHELHAPETRGGLIALEPGTREVGLLEALSKRVVQRKTDRPRREIRREDLTEHGPERRVLSADNRAGKTARAQQLRTPEPVGRVRGLQAKVRQRLVSRQDNVRIADLDLFARFNNVGTLGQRSPDRRVNVGRGGRRRDRGGGVEPRRPEVGSLWLE
jgi:hypothetical protein